MTKKKSPTEGVISGDFELMETTSGLFVVLYKN